MNNLPAIATVSLNSSLKAACTAPTEWAYDPENPRASEPRSGTWTLPSRITQRLKSDARSALPSVDAALRPADQKTVKDWLGALGVLVAGNASVADARMKLAAYGPLLDHPASCFTRESLEAAGRAFKFFPSFSELAVFLDHRAEPIRTLRARLKLIADAELTEVEQAPPKYSELTPDQRAEHDRLMAEFRGWSRRAEPDQPPPKPKPVYVNSPLVDEYVAQAKGESAA